MKIVLNNESEKKIFKKFMDFVQELCLDDEISEMDKEAFELDSTELDFIENGLYCATLEIDPTVSQFELNDDIVTGTCTKCGMQTQGTYDGGYVTFE